MSEGWGVSFCLRIARNGRGGIIVHPREERPREGLKRAKNGVSGNEVRTFGSKLALLHTRKRAEALLRVERAFGFLVTANGQLPTAVLPLGSAAFIARHFAALIRAKRVLRKPSD